MEQVPQDLHRYKRWLCTLLAIIIVGYLAVEESPQAIGNENSLRDTSVIEAVLIDLLSRSNSPIEPKNETPRILYFSPEAVGQEIDREAVLSTTDATAFDNLSTKQLMRVREAADHLIRRVKRNEPFTDFQPKDSRIKLYSTNIDRRHFRKRRFNLPQIFRAYPPGYSRDSELAIVRLSFTWSGNMHGAAGLYVLTKRMMDGQCYSQILCSLSDEVKFRQENGVRNHFAARGGPARCSPPRPFSSPPYTAIDCAHVGPLLKPNFL